MSIDDGVLDFAALPPPLVGALEASGWFWGRKVDVGEIVAELVEQGYRSNPFAVSFLEAFSGLRIPPLNSEGPNFANTESLIIDPGGVGRRHRSEAAEVESVVNEDVFPVAWWLSYSYVYITASARMVAFSSGLIWLLGDSLERGLDMAVRASAELTCIGSRAGQPRWPALR
ncbi:MULTISPECIES: SUKH-3 domain-containing protein [unclassified Micromonospora]|uniref:SUKH-3 domain-containing protein n=1 Tax=unclassified Micromonospora TaxID=2617518 RepID=UPI003630C5AD